MNANYSIFFSIELLHEYFLNQKNTDLEILPADDLREVSRKMNIHFRTIEHRLVALIKDNGNNEPFFNIPPNKIYRQYYEKVVFRFYLKVKDPVFLNYTNIELAASNKKKKYYFSNLSGNNRDGANYLSAPIPEYVSGKTYVPGDLVKDPATGRIFEAIKKHSTKKKSPFSDDTLWVPKGLLHLPKPVEDYAPGKTYLPGDLARKPATENVYEALSRHVAGNEKELEDPQFWLARGTGIVEYPTTADQVDYTSGSFEFPLTVAVSKADIQVFRFNYDVKKPAFDQPVRETESRVFEQPVSAVLVDLSALEPGRYEIRINKESRLVYYDPAINLGNFLGVIEIFNHLPAKDSYALLDEEEKLKSPGYQLHFANRRVLWKYIRKDGKADSITDTGDTGYAFNLSGNDFVSAFPIALSENVIKTLKLEFNSKDFRVFPLPNPQVTRLARHRQNDYDYLCSEVYLNY